jgi:hypothetical protein
MNERKNAYMRIRRKLQKNYFLSLTPEEVLKQIDYNNEEIIVPGYGGA